MDTLREMGYDYSRREGNPTSTLQAHYQDLMVIQDPDELARTALKIVEPLVGTGMSEKNWIKFQRDLEGAAERGLTGLKKYLTNYILAGSNLGVGRGGRGGMAREATQVDQIASFITEDVNECVILTKEQQYLKQLVESCTSFKVCLKS